ncbi:hypothetical protein TI05_10370 [Achromatium sp. WMS3]|nr:hypothetical protein TI05_10370 [Achromatium sp. WMS3]
MLLELDGLEPEIEEQAMPSVNHSYLTKQLIYELEANKTWEAWPELTLKLNKNETTPDISVFEPGKIRPNFQSDTIKCEEMPKLVIEIISPTQGIQRLVDKAKELLEAGVPTVWLLEPFTNNLLAYNPQGMKRYKDGKVSVDGITIDLEKLFKE